MISGEEIMLNRFINNTVWQVAGKVFQMLVGLFVYAWIARYLGPDDLGSLSYTLSYITFFTSIANLGINNVIIKELVDNRNNEGLVLGSSLVLRLLSSTLSWITVVILAYFITQGNETLIIITLLQGLSLIFQQFELIRYWYNSHLNSKVATLVITAAYLLLTIYRIIILLLKGDIYLFAFATAFEQISLALLLYLSYRKYSDQKLKFSKQVAIDILRKSHHFIYAGLIMTMFNQMDKIMLGLLKTTKEVGYYTIALGINSMWSFVITAIISSAEPIIMTSFNENKEKYEKLIKRLYASIFYLSILAGIAITILSKYIIIILYGSKYLPSVDILKLTSWIVVFTQLNIARGIWIVCEKKEKYLTYMLVIGAFMNVILNYFLIKEFGAMGAAIATILTQFVVAIIIPLFFKETRESSILILKGIIFR